MKFRKIIFWLHLVIGLVAGLVIAVTAFTGASMAFEKQIVAWCERKEAHVNVPSKDAERWSLQDLVAKVRDEYPDARPQSIVVSSDPTMVVAISLSRTNTLYADPYTGEFQPQGAKKARAFFDLMLRWHRWLGTSAPEGKAGGPGGNPGGEPPRQGGGLRGFASTVVGGSCAVFFTLSISGLYLWWPRQWTKKTLGAITLMDFKLKGKPRDWNWHNAIGFWASPILILTTFTGLVMAFRPIGDLIYKRPDGENSGVKIAAPAPGTRPLDNDVLLAIAQKTIPDWETITLRMGNRRQRGQGGTNAVAATNAPARAPQPVTIAVTEKHSWSPVPVQLQLDPYTGEVLLTERVENFGYGRAFRAMNRSLHTGEAGGPMTQTLSFLACLGALVLVWTGFALAWRRFFGRKTPATTADTL